MTLTKDQFDVPCPTCKTKGEMPDGDICSTCEGYGHLLTDEGEALVAFLKRRGVDFGMSPKAENELGGE